jgi:2-oxo-4-hydroxy-4-carboxy-5-ureidoimidazoline decarboxylase
MIALTALNAFPAPEFTQTLADIFEHSPWVARAAADQRPFASIDALHAAMVAAVDAAPRSQALALLRAHPELAAGGPLTAASAAEQGGKGLDRLSGERAALLRQRNAAYREKFGFPFIIAVRGQRDIEMIIAAVAGRLDHAPDEEFHIALAEVAKIARYRLQDMVTAE